jgi:hypothetical protein
MSRKNHDYTSGSGDPYANFRTAEQLGVHPAVGIMLRMGDKMQRIRTFAERGELKVDGEGLEDAVVDCINYAVLAYGLLLEDAEHVDTLLDEVMVTDGMGDVPPTGYDSLNHIKWGPVEVKGGCEDGSIIQSGFTTPPNCS